VGEIGISRREFLYDIRFWEVRRIIRGYRKRGRLTNQLLAETVYATIHVMRDPKGKTPSDMFPQIFEDDDEEYLEPQLTPEECAGLQADMDAWNARHQGETQP
jgi:hypothetical protein